MKKYNKKISIFAISFLLVLLPSHTVFCQTSLYISPQGNDLFSGNSPEQSFQTFERVAKEIREIKQTSLHEDSIYIFLRGGNYEIEKALVFRPEDSGTKNSPNIYKAYKDEVPIINGGKIIEGWQEWKAGIWKAKVDTGWVFRQLYVNGELKQRAKTPNEGFYKVAGLPDGSYPEVPWQTSSKRFIYHGDDLNSSWKNIDDVEIIVYHFWTDVHLRIDKIDSKNKLVSFKYPTTKVFNDDFSSEGARYLVENLFEGLDEPGEWYLDKKEGVIYYMPEEGEEMQTAEVIAPISTSFLELQGNPLARQYVEYLQFEGITFRFTTWNLPPDETNDGQASSKVPAAVTLTGAENCIFSRCSFENIGTYGVDISKGCSKIKFQNNNFKNLAAGGFRINGGTEKEHPLLRTFQNTISDNYIQNYGTNFSSGVGILLMNTYQNLISHNEICDGFYTAISVGWSWGYQRSISWNNRIEYNHIHDIGHGLLSDMGGIYTLGVSPGTTIRNNVIHDINSHNYGGWGIYNDEGSSHILVENNLVYNTKFSPYNIHFSKEVTVRNNIFALGRKDQLSRTRIDPHQSVYFENNIVYWETGELFSGNWKDSTYVFHFLPDDMGFRANREVSSTFEMDWNIYYNPLIPKDSAVFFGHTFSEWVEMGKDIHSLYTDPLFVAPKDFDFRLQPNSPAFKLGFRSFNYSEAGPRPYNEVKHSKCNIP